MAAPFVTNAQIELLISRSSGLDSILESDAIDPADLTDPELASAWRRAGDARRAHAHAKREIFALLVEHKDR